jgi:polysaccharide export outer membrane protein
VRLCQRAVSSRILVECLLALPLAALLGSGCAVTPLSQSIPPAQAAASPTATQINSALAHMTSAGPTSTADYRLGADDLLEITLFNIPESRAGIISRRTEVRVTQGGMITLPLLGDIPAAGLTPSTLERVLRERYDAHLYNPQVGVQVKEYRGQRISVLGAVRNPGIFQLSGPNTLADLLAMAGGINERAGSQVHIYRQQGEGRQTYVVDLLTLASNPELVNMPVQPGDLISVPQTGMFFVDGAIGRPGSYPLNQPHTLTQALAVAGGITEALADYSSVAIFRRRDALEADKISVNLKDILAGRTSDPQIEANDVIVVPMSTAKYIVERFLGTIGLGLPTPIF